MTASSLADARDEIIISVSREMDVPIEDIMRLRGRRATKASEARSVAMWILSNDVDALGVPELVELFATTERTVDQAWWLVAHTPRLRAIARRLIKEHADVLARLPKVRDGEGD